MPDQIRYAEFQAQGYPIGSGAVESANKLVVEARLKGSGMHWARAHADPMLELRTVVCSDRWEEVWPQISQRLRKRPESAGWDDGSGQEGRRVWKQRRIPGQRLGGDCQAPSSVPGNMPGKSMARTQTLAQAFIGYPQRTTLGAAWPSGENASLQAIPIRPTRKPDAHPTRQGKFISEACSCNIHVLAVGWMNHRVLAGSSGTPEIRPRTGASIVSPKRNVSRSS